MIFPLIPPFIRDFPWLCQITKWYLWTFYTVSCGHCSISSEVASSSSLCDSCGICLQPFQPGAVELVLNNISGYIIKIYLNNISIYIIHTICVTTSTMVWSGGCFIFLGSLTGWSQICLRKAMASLEGLGRNSWANLGRQGLCIVTLA